MEFEYKSIELARKGRSIVQLTQNDCEMLNAQFNAGWEYVDSICQSVSISIGGTENGSVLVILKRKKG